MTGLDYSAGPIDPAEILAAGYDTVFRYVDNPVYGLPSKCVTPVEYNELVAAGITVYLVFEHLTDDFAGGFLLGAINAQRALAGASRVDYAGPIFMAIDTHLSPTQLSVAIDYLDGASHVLGARLGVYGFTELIQACQAHELGTVYWQCGHPPTAGSTVHVWQDNTMSTTVGGVQCDIDRILLTFPETDDMAAVPQDQWDDVYSQICGLFEAWGGGTTGDPNNTAYDFIQFLLRANVQLNQLTLEVASLKEAVAAIAVPKADVIVSSDEVNRMVDAAVQATMHSIGQAISQQRG